MKVVTKAVIPAAGLGTRFLPATKAQPKEMLPLIDTPAIQYIVEEAVQAGIEEIVIITGRGKRAIEDHFDRSVELERELQNRGKEDLLDKVRYASSLADIFYIRQSEPKGLGHAIGCAEAFIGNEPFAVLLGDDIVRSDVPAIKQLMNVYERVEGTVVGVQSVPLEQVSRYGIIEPQWEGETCRVGRMVEKPPATEAPSTLAIMGRYIIEPQIFSVLKHLSPGVGGEIQLTDALDVLRQDGQVYACDFEGQRLDIGTPMGFLRSTVELALSRSDIQNDFSQYLLHTLEQRGLIDDSGASASSRGSLEGVSD